MGKMFLQVGTDCAKLTNTSSACHPSSEVRKTMSSGCTQNKAITSGNALLPATTSRAFFLSMLLSFTFSYPCLSSLAAGTKVQYIRFVLPHAQIHRYGSHQVSNSVHPLM